MQSVLYIPNSIKIPTESSAPEDSEPLNKEEVLQMVESLIKCCEMNLIEIEESKKTAMQINNNQNTSINKSIYDTTFILQDSYLLPNVKNLGNFKQEEKEFWKNQNLKNLGKCDLSLSESFSLIDSIEENFTFIKKKLIEFKNLVEKETILNQKKEYKQKKLEKLKKSYSVMKKVYENAIRRGIKIV